MKRTARTVHAVRAVRITHARLTFKLFKQSNRCSGF